MIKKLLSLCSRNLFFVYGSNFQELQLERNLYYFSRIWIDDRLQVYYVWKKNVLRPERVDNGLNFHVNGVSRAITQIFPPPGVV